MGVFIPWKLPSVSNQSPPPPQAGQSQQYAFAMRTPGNSNESGFWPTVSENTDKDLEKPVPGRVVLWSFCQLL